MREISPESPEARRHHPFAHPRMSGLLGYVGPGSRLFEICRRIFVGVYNDGFIHAGNIAYLTLLTIFPFFIVIAAIAQLIGISGETQVALHGMMATLPSGVASIVESTAQEVLTARTGNLLWFGAIVGLWTVGSFIETLREILRRAYGTDYGRPFWQNRLAGIVIVFGAMGLLITAFSAQVLMTAAQEVLIRYVPAANGAAGWLASTKLIPVAAIFLATLALFWALTPSRYRWGGFPKWPGALLITVWWYLALTLLPRALESLGGYALTYGGLAGVIIALLFFWLVGFGLVVGAQLNAALADAGQSGLKAPQD